MFALRVWCESQPTQLPPALNHSHALQRQVEWPATQVMHADDDVEPAGEKRFIGHGVHPTAPPSE